MKIEDVVICEVIHDIFTVSNIRFTFSEKQKTYSIS